jgi:hypothetical protein
MPLPNIRTSLVNVRDLQPYLTVDVGLVDGGDAGEGVGGKVAVIFGAVGVAILGIFTKSFLTQGYYF